MKVRAAEGMIAESGNDPALIAQPINGDAAGKNLLTINQLTADDFIGYFGEARAAVSVVRDPVVRGLDILQHSVLTAAMMQSSTRTGGSMVSAMEKLGGDGHLLSGMASSAEAKGESREDSIVALATQSDIIGIRTKENDGPEAAAQAIAQSFEYGKLSQRVPVINLGNGTGEHPTQALGDMFTVGTWLQHDYDKFDGLTMAVVGDHERYRAFHSALLAAKILNMTVIAVESEVATVPEELAHQLGDSLERTTDLDEAMRDADVLMVGRNPDEYEGDDPWEQLRSRWLADSYKGWTINHARLQQMRPDGIVLHPRPRRDELDPSIDADPRAWDVEQMALMIPVRMAIIARHLGVSIVDQLAVLEAAGHREIVQ
jgi:aspartate carbamoyltransferase catalytic subunit